MRSREPTMMFPCLTTAAARNEGTLRLQCHVGHVPWVLCYLGNVLPCTPYISRLHPCRLLDGWVYEARKHGVPAHKTISWIRRKIGTDVAVIRIRADGSLGCAVPCVLCQRELLKYDLRVHCVEASGAWFSGKLTQAEAPPPVLTAGQRRMFKRN
jgi:hypothetical protein